MMTYEESRDPSMPSSDESLGQLLESMNSLRGRRLHEYAAKLTVENHQMRQVHEQVAAKHEELRAKLDSLCAPQKYPVAIARVTNNGSLCAEVVGHGGVRTQVAVDPDIQPGQLLVGKRGILAKGQNCLLHIDEAEPDWQDVAEFEDYLPGQRRILIRHQEQLLAVTAADSLSGTDLKKGDLVGFDRVTGLAYCRVDQPAKDALFAEEIPHDEFAELGGLEVPISQVKRAIDFRIRFPEVARRYGVRTKRGILLSGQPGNGKTRIGRCCCTYVNQLLPDTKCRFMSFIGASDVYSMWFGESERRLRERFAAAEEAAQQGPVILFFDELDAIGRCRGSEHGSGAPDRILNTLLGLLDGIKNLSNVIVMAATNRPDTLDPGLVRPGRFDLKISIPAPNRRAARTILHVYLQNLPLAPQYESLDQLTEPLLSRIYSPNSEYAQVVTVKLSDGRNLAVPAKDLVSGAMVENISRVAAELAALRETQTSGPRGLTEEDLAVALHQELCGMTSLLTPGNVRAYVASIPQDVHPVAVSRCHRAEHAPLYVS